MALRYQPYPAAACWASDCGTTSVGTSVPDPVGTDAQIDQKAGAPAKPGPRPVVVLGDLALHPPVEHYLEDLFLRVPIGRGRLQGVVVGEHGLRVATARLAAGLEKMHENEARAGGASAEEEEASWLKRLSEIERKEERLLDLPLEGDITAEQFRARSGALRETKEAATAGLETARARRSRREDFERDKEALLEYHARLVPENLDGLTPEQRRTLYRMMRLEVAVRDGALTTADWGCNDEPTLPSSFVSTTYAFRLRAVLGGQDAEIEVSRLQPVQAGTKTQWAGYLAFERS